MIFLRDFSGFEIIGRNNNTILMALHSGDVLRFKYVNGANRADSAALARYWCESLSLLRQRALEQQASRTLAGELLRDVGPDGVGPDAVLRPPGAQYDGVQGGRVTAHGKPRKVPDGTPVRTSNAVPATSPQRSLELMERNSHVSAVNGTAFRDLTGANTPETPERSSGGAPRGVMAMPIQAAPAAGGDGIRAKAEKRSNGSIRKMHVLVDSIEAQLSQRRPSTEAATKVAAAGEGGVGTYIDSGGYYVYDPHEQNNLSPPPPRPTSTTTTTTTTPISLVTSSDGHPRPYTGPIPPAALSHSSRRETVPQASQLQVQQLQSRRSLNQQAQTLQHKEVDLDTSL